MVTQFSGKFIEQIPGTTYVKDSTEQRINKLTPPARKGKSKLTSPKCEALIEWLSDLVGG